MKELKVLMKQKFESNGKNYNISMLRSYRVLQEDYGYQKVYLGPS